VEARKPATIGLTVLAYVVVAFGVQGASHFALFAAHYAAIPIMRAEPVIAMGLGSMLIQGVLFALLFPAFQRGGDSVWDGVRFSWVVDRGGGERRVRAVHTVRRAARPDPSTQGRGDRGT